MDSSVVVGIATTTIATATTVLSAVFPIVFGFAITVLLVFVAWRLVKRGVKGH